MRRKGFTLIELMIVIAIIAIIAAIAIPQLLRSRIGANETSAMGTLKAVSAGQEQFRTASCVDSNNNGIGEYGFLMELSGAGVCRISSINVATSPYIPSIFNLDESTKSGYGFTTFLCSTLVTNATNVYVPGAVGVGAGTVAIAAAINEENYLCYAWPTTAGRTGNRVFVISPQGTVMQHPNSAAPPACTGATEPVWSAALTIANWSTGTFVNAGGIGIGIPNVAGAAWTPIG